MNQTASQVQRFVANSMSAAMQMVKKALGPDAVIISDERIDGKVHLIAGPQSLMNTESHAASQAQHAQKTASALTQLKSDKQPGKVNPYFFQAHDKRFSNVAIVGATESTNTSIQQNANNYSSNSGAAVESEIRAIKKLMHAYYQAQAWSQFQKDNLLQAIIYNKLVAIGFEPETIGDFVSDLPKELGFDEGWITVLNKIVQHIKIFEPSKVHKKINIMVGPSGSGKTTLLGKYFMQNMSVITPERISVISLSQDKLTTVHEAKAFKNVFNVNAYYVETIEELKNAIELSEKKTHIFIDPPSFHNLDQAYINYFSEIQDNINYYYVLPSTTQQKYIENLIELNHRDNIAAISITKIDESNNYIPLINVAIKHSLPIAYLNISSGMTEPLINAQRAQIMTDLLMVVNQTSSNQLAIDDHMGHYLMEKIENEPVPQVATR